MKQEVSGDNSRFSKVLSQLFNLIHEKKMKETIRSSIIALVIQIVLLICSVPVRELNDGRLVNTILLLMIVASAFLIFVSTSVLRRKVGKAAFLADLEFSALSLVSWAAVTRLSLPNGFISFGWLRLSLVGIALGIALIITSQRARNKAAAFCGLWFLSLIILLLVCQAFDNYWVTLGASFLLFALSFFPVFEQVGSYFVGADQKKTTLQLSTVYSEVTSPDTKQEVRRFIDGLTSYVSEQFNLPVEKFTSYFQQPAKLEALRKSIGDNAYFADLILLLEALILTHKCVQLFELNPDTPGAADLLSTIDQSWGQFCALSSPSREGLVADFHQSLEQGESIAPVTGELETPEIESEGFPGMTQRRSRRTQGSLYNE